MLGRRGLILARRSSRSDKGYRIRKWEVGSGKNSGPENAFEARSPVRDGSTHPIEVCLHGVLTFS